MSCDSNRNCNCDDILPKQPHFEPHYGNCKAIWDSGNRDKNYPVNKDGSISLPNPHLSKLNGDVLYHLALDTFNYDLQALFGDVKFVCMGGTKHRMKEFGEHMKTALSLKEAKLVNLTKNSHRYAMYKIGPVLSVSHGIGIPSMTILLQEIIKLLSYAKAKQPIIFRIGTSGGLKLTPGSVVISSFGMNGCLDKTYEMPILGKLQKLPALFDKRLRQELESVTSKSDGFDTFVGGTMAADDFYRGQARIDGPFCDHSEEDKMSFLNHLYELGVRNIEMEATAFAAFTSEAGLRAADVCVTLVDRLKGDQVSTSKATLLEWQKRPMLIVGKYIQKYYENLK